MRVRSTNQLLLNYPFLLRKCTCVVGERAWILYSFFSDIKNQIKINLLKYQNKVHIRSQYKVYARCDNWASLFLHTCCFLAFLPTTTRSTTWDHNKFKHNLKFALTEVKHRDTGSTQIAPRWPIVGQKFPRYFDKYLELFAVFKHFYLFNDLSRNPWGYSTESYLWNTASNGGFSSTSL